MNFFRKFIITKINGPAYCQFLWSHSYHCAFSIIKTNYKAPEKTGITVHRIRRVPVLSATCFGGASSRNFRNRDRMNRNLVELGRMADARGPSVRWPVRVWVGGRGDASAPLEPALCIIFSLISDELRAPDETAPLRNTDVGVFESPSPTSPPKPCLVTPPPSDGTDAVKSFRPQLALFGRDFWLQIVNGNWISP